MPASGGRSSAGKLCLDGQWVRQEREDLVEELVGSDAGVEELGAAIATSARRSASS
jgi:hypothetical protein